MRLPAAVLALAPFLAAGCASTPPGVEGLTAVVTIPVAYEQDGVALTGSLSYDPDAPGPRPGVLVIHEWWGLGEHSRRFAKDLARAGYTAFALDMYGTGKLTTDPDEAGRWAGQFRGEGRDLGRARARAGLEVLRRDPRVDPTRLAAVGFCFGGTVALELAWAGEDLDAVVAFHSHPTVPRPGEAAVVKASILVCHGAEDPFVPPETLEAFETAMREAGLDWMLVKYARAVHSFTNPEADGSFNPGAKYDPTAARRAREHMESLLRERLRP